MKYLILILLAFTASADQTIELNGDLNLVGTSQTAETEITYNLEGNTVELCIGISLNGTSPPDSGGDIPGSDNLVLWVDPSDSSNTTTSGGRYDLLTDKSGNGNDMAATAPLRKMFTGRTLNGLDVMDAQGAQAMQVTFPTEIPQPYTIATVFELDSLAVWNWVYGGQISGKWIIFTPYRSGGATYTDAGTGVNGGSIIATTDPTVLITNVDASGNVTHYLNGVKDLDGSFIGTNPIKDFTVGARVLSSGQYFDGILGDYFIWDKSLDTTEMNSIQTILGDKYGITTTEIL